MHWYSKARGEVALLDTEPRYLRSLLQFLYTGHVPLLSLQHAFQLLYLATKYIVKVRLFFFFFSFSYASDGPTFHSLDPVPYRFGHNKMDKS